MGDLLPCPWCGETKIEPVDATRILGMWNIIHRCPVIGPFKIELSTREDVISIWNTRALPSATQAGGWMPPDIDAIENGGKRWHGEDHRVVSVRWEPYKPDGQRQMKAKGRWQEQVGSGDYWRWQNCERPAFAPLPPAPESAD